MAAHPDAMLIGREEKALVAEAKYIVPFPIGTATELLDTYGPYSLLLAMGGDIVPVLVGPHTGRFVSVLHEQSDDFYPLTEETRGYTLESAMSFEDVLKLKHKMVGGFFSGGRAPEYIRDDDALLDLVRYLFEKGLPVGSVCHGIEIVAAAGVLKGRRAATVTKCRLDMLPCGGEYVEDPAVVDGNFFSWKTYHQARFGLRQWLEALQAEVNQRELVQRDS
jgi:protease I